MSRRFLLALLVAALALGACGGGDGGGESTTTSGSDEEVTTTAASATTTEAGSATTEADGGTRTVDIGDIPQECIDAFVDYLRAIEPIVEGVDWANASLSDLEEMGTAIEPATTEFEAATADSACDEIEVDADDEETFDYLIELAQDEAPGTVGYFEMIRDFAAGFGDEAEVSGDCETDIAALQAIVDEGGTLQDMAFGAMGAVGNLTTSISANCSPERALEFFSQEDVTAFMGTG